MSQWRMFSSPPPPLVEFIPGLFAKRLGVAESGVYTKLKVAESECTSILCAICAQNNVESEFLQNRAL